MIDLPYQDNVRSLCWLWGFMGLVLYTLYMPGLRISGPGKSLLIEPC